MKVTTLMMVIMAISILAMRMIMMATMIMIIIIEIVMTIKIKTNMQILPKPWCTQQSECFVEPNSKKLTTYILRSSEILPGKKALS